MNHLPRSFRGARLSVAVLAACAAAPIAALAAPPAGSAYDTDPQNTYVQDATSEGIGTVNMISCYLNAMAPAKMVNKGPYKALVDGNKCDAAKRSTDTSGAGNAAVAPSFEQATVDSTRASNSDPMVAKIWLASAAGPGDMPASIHIGLSASAEASASAPYGVFRMDFCGVAAGSSACVMQGALVAQTTGLSFYQREPDGGQVRETRLALTRVSTADSGSGKLAFSENGHAAGFTFAYDPSLYRRSDGTGSDLCFSRDKSLADASVWRYALYQEDGAAVQVNSGFPVTWTEAASGKSYQGHVGYYGLWMQDGKGDAVKSGDTLVRQVYGQNAVGQSYRLVRAPGRLTKHVRQVTPLDKLLRVKLMVNYMVQGAPEPGKPSQPSTFANHEMYWNGANFVKSGTMQEVSPGNWRIVPLEPEVVLDNARWANVRGGVQGHAQSLGGEVRIADAALAAIAAGNGATAQVATRKQTLVYPADMPARLHCLRECADAASLAAYFGTTPPSGSPYLATTGTEWSATGWPKTDLVTYTSDAAAGTIAREGGAAVVWNPAWSASGNFRWGVRVNRLYADLAPLSCDADATRVCAEKFDDVDFYSWETGPENYNQFVALTTLDGSACGTSQDRYCRFDPPLDVTYVVPEGAAFGAYAGQRVTLQYGGYGNLWNIPGTCVDKFTNQAKVSCTGDPNERYVPAFVIPFDPVSGVVKAVADGKTYWVKWLDREVRFKKLDLAACSALTLPTGLTLPDGSDFLNPGPAAPSTYIGLEPKVDGAPRVVDGEVKY